MTEREALLRLQELNSAAQPHFPSALAEANRMCVELVRSLGYPELMAEFDKLRKRAKEAAKAA